MKDKSDEEERPGIGKTPTVAELIELSHQNYLEILEMRKHSREQAAEIRKQMRKTDRRMAETAKMIKETSEQMKEDKERMKETDRRMAETDRRMAETDRQMAETARRMAETDRQMAETDRRMKQLQDLFTTQWGKLVEALAKPACLKLFSDLGIGITQVYNGPRKGKYFCNEMEIDVILCNTTVAVAVEVKTTCKIEHIDHFLQQMEHFKETFHPFANYTVYPAVAALKYDEGSDVYASKKGMFVLHANGEDMFDLVEPQVRMEY